MLQKANPLVIGIFGMGAIGLAVMSLLFFGTTRWLKETERIVVFFEESVNGLDLGAPVKFNGVPIGQVVGIHLSLDADQSQAEIPVILSVEEQRLREVLGVSKDQNFKSICEKAVSRGLRARLQYQSFVTGLLFVDIGYYPMARPPKPVTDSDFDYAVLPPMASGLGEVWKTASATFSRISQVDFVGISQELYKFLKSLNQSIDTIRFKELDAKLMTVLNDFDEFLNGEDTKHTIAAIKETFTKMSGVIEPMSEDWHATLGEAHDAFHQLQQTLHDLDEMVDPNRPFRYELESAMQSFKEAVEAIRALADTLEQNPAVLLVGKP